ncbi:hypothetical protein L1887_58147 [Cichorium endivia]|nr:hypothetical protein L1887_58147 [Cichorium endivia]
MLPGRADEAFGANLRHGSADPRSCRQRRCPVCLICPGKPCVGYRRPDRTKSEASDEERRMRSPQITTCLVVLRYEGRLAQGSILRCSTRSGAMYAATRKLESRRNASNM